MAAAGHYALLARAPAGCPPPPITGSSGHVPHVSRAFGERLGTRPLRGAHRPPCPRGWLGSPRPPVPPSHAAACPLFVNVRSPLATGFFPVPLLASCLRWPSSPLDKEPGAPRRHGVPPEQRPQGVRPMRGLGTETRVPVARRRRRETRGRLQRLRLQRLRLREGRGVGVPVPPTPPPLSSSGTHVEPPLSAAAFSAGAWPPAGVHGRGGPCAFRPGPPPRPPGKQRRPLRLVRRPL